MKLSDHVYDVLKWMRDIRDKFFALPIKEDD